MAVIPVRRMYNSVSAGLPAKSEGFVSIMVRSATIPGACCASCLKHIGLQRAYIMSSPKAWRQCCAGALQMCMTVQHAAAALKAWSGYTGDAAAAVRAFDAACAKGSLRTAWRLAGSSGGASGKLLTPSFVQSSALPIAELLQARSQKCCQHGQHCHHASSPAACCQLQAWEQSDAQQNQPCHTGNLTERTDAYR
jgi:hypothetical protein